MKDASKVVDSTRAGIYPSYTNTGLQIAKRGVRGYGQSGVVLINLGMGLLDLLSLSTINIAVNTNCSALFSYAMMSG